ncbi:MAG: exosortase/archaeosortase family protein [Desulfobacterales bacterium]|nr:exosortase/archaeosortase family protein [Desulfobacterales bacterium]
MASPHTAGAAALLLAEDASRTPDQIRALLKSKALPRTAAQCPKPCGAGLLNAGVAPPLPTGVAVALDARDRQRAHRHGGAGHGHGDGDGAADAGKTVTFLVEPGGRCGQPARRHHQRQWHRDRHRHRCRARQRQPAGGIAGCRRQCPDRRSRPRGCRRCRCRSRPPRSWRCCCCTRGGCAAPVGHDCGRAHDGEPRAPPRWPLVSVSAALAALWLALLAAPVTVVLAPLAALTAAMTAHMLAALGLPVVRELTVLTHAGGFACEIDTACTALVPAVLLGAALLASRRSWPARLAGVAAGIAGLVLVNQLRLVSLVWIGVYAPGWFDLAHLWLWPPLLALAAVGHGLAWWRVSARRA